MNPKEEIKSYIIVNLLNHKNIRLSEELYKAII